MNKKDIENIIKKVNNESDFHRLEIDLNCIKNDKNQIQNIKERIKNKKKDLKNIRSQYDKDKSFENFLKLKEAYSSLENDKKLLKKSEDNLKYSKIFNIINKEEHYLMKGNYIKYLYYKNVDFITSKEMILFYICFLIITFFLYFFHLN